METPYELDREKDREFSSFVADHIDAAYNLARWILTVEQDAEDVVQDAFLRAFRGYATFRGENPRAWILTIVRNTAYNHLRKTRHMSETSLNDVVVERLEGDAEGLPDREIIREGEKLALAQALAKLPTEYREAIVLREIEELSYKEIARMQLVPLGTVMSRLARGRMKLRELLLDGRKENQA